ncbi:multidrug effflux MFS transporter [Aliiroseovarius sp.]|uniref:multidrug effflux MFS transporter n=1 Tax=Aliiroseovarius sp. TaxID=1872442 RepID=UPI0026272897|nr:multidrug effflux MFS transporter [Aliiroseovarius sp.]
MARKTATKPALDRTDTVVFLGGITALTAVSVDIVLPSTGVVARSFGAPEQQGALLVGLYFIAYAVGQLFWGLFSDAFGRRRALLMTLAGFTLASLACAMAASFQGLLIARFIQGLFGASPIIARAMVRDVAHGEEAARIMTVLGAILTMATMFAPVLGSGLLILFSWRAIFVFLALLAMVFATYTWFSLGETGGEKRPERFTLGFIRSAGARLLTTRSYLVPMAVGGLTFGGYVSVGATGAIIAEQRYGVSPEAFGALFAIVAGVNTGGALFARQLLTRISLRQVGTLAVSLLGLAGLVNLGLAFADPSLPAFWGGVCLYVAAFGIILPTSMAAAMEPAGDMPGFAASLMGALQMVMASLGAFIASSLFDGTNLAISLTMALFAGLAVAVLTMGRMLDRRDRGHSRAE